MTATSHFQEIEHTADLALNVRGSTLLELFVNAAVGMYSLMTDVAQIEALVLPIPSRACPERSRRIEGSGAEASDECIVEVSGIDAETLLVNWLNELLYYTEVEGLVFGSPEQFEIVQFAPDHLRAVVRRQAGAPLQKQVKAATFHNLRIETTGNGYEVTIVFDV